MFQFLDNFLALVFVSFSFFFISILFCRFFWLLFLDWFLLDFFNVFILRILFWDFFHLFFGIILVGLSTEVSFVDAVRFFGGSDPLFVGDLKAFEGIIAW